MTTLGPLVERLVATVTADGMVIITARPPGPAGLAQATVADGALEVEVDVAEPENLVGLRFARDRIERRSGDVSVERILWSVIGDDAVIRLQHVLATDEADVDQPAVLWQGPPVPERLDARTLADLADRTDGLDLLGRLALLTGELTRTERSALGTALGLIELAQLAQDLSKELQPSPRSDALLDAAFGHLRRWAEEGTDDWWIEQLTGRQRDQLTRLVDPLARRLRLRDPALAERMGDLIDALHDLDAGGFEQGAVHPAAMGAPSEAGPADRFAPMVTGDGSRLAQSLAIRGDAVDDRHRAARTPAQVIDVVIDPALSGITDARGEIAEGHVHVTGLGRTDRDAWVRVFRADPQPVLVAMAPLAVTSIGTWSARALLPAEAPAERLLVDLTATPRDPWRSPQLRQAVTAVDLGAFAARATRRGDRDAPDHWGRSADAWRRAGDDDRFRTAQRLAVASASGPYSTAPNRNAPDATPLAVDLVD